MKVGDTVFALRINNQARYYKGKPIEDRIIEDTVSKIGRTYFYLDGGEFSQMKFCKKERVDISDYCSNFRIFDSIQDVIDSFEKTRLYGVIQKEFDRYSSLTKLTLCQLKEIEKILNN